MYNFYQTFTTYFLNEYSPSAIRIRTFNWYKSIGTNHSSAFGAELYRNYWIKSKLRTFDSSPYLFVYFDSHLENTVKPATFAAICRNLLKNLSQMYVITMNINVYHFRKIFRLLFLDRNLISVWLYSACLMIQHYCPMLPRMRKKNKNVKVEDTKLKSHFITVLLYDFPPNKYRRNNNYLKKFWFDWTMFIELKFNFKRFRFSFCNLFFLYFCSKNININVNVCIFCCWNIVII